jgi:hypothetical protein
MRGLALLVCSALGCAAPAPAPQRQPPAGAASSTPAPAPAPAYKVLPEAHSDFPLRVVREDAVYEHVLEASVRAIAVDKQPHVSALGERTVHIHDQKGWREEVLPAAGLGEARLALFYGRDYRLRLVGTRSADGGLETLYYRWLPGGFRPAPDEIGRLGSTRKGGFVALLGTADPEVVCRPGDVCLIKRSSGWATITAPPEIELVAIDRGQAWAVAGKSLLKVDADKRWAVVTDSGPWSKANALWVTSGKVWVVETEASKIHQFDEGWSLLPSPSLHPRAFLARESNDLWLGGEDGLFTCRQRETGNWEWRKVLDPPGGVGVIAYHPAQKSSIWVGGRAGLFRITA